MPEKCNFCQKSVTFLEHEISDQGIGTCHEKIKAVSEWPVPTNIREVRAFVVAASYYRRFVRNFASIAAPLHALIKNNQRLIWGDKEQEVFEKLKAALTFQPILAMPCPENSSWIRMRLTLALEQFSVSGRCGTCCGIRQQIVGRS